MSSQTAQQTSSPSAGNPVGQKPQQNKKSASAFRTISEVANELDVQQHVLRFWETKFSQVRPLKRGGGRRYYRPEDVVLLQKIHHLLYTEGYTIKGVQKLLRELGKNQVVSGQLPKPVKTQSVAPSTPAPLTASRPSAAGAGMSQQHRAVLQAMLDELKELRSLVRAQD